VIAGDEVTGASTFRIVRELDAGPVFGVLTEVIRPDDTSGALLERLAVAGSGLLRATLDGIAEGTVVPVAQPPDGVSLAPKLTVEEARIDWSTPAMRVDRLIRGCTPAPGAWTTFRSERLRLGPVRPLAGQHDLAAGRIAVTREGVRVGTATHVVQLGEVTRAGKRPTHAAGWARGVRIEAGEGFG
jgi:methionyl-tRNA formyltransferase